MWDLIGSLLPPCCLPSAPHACAGFIWSGTQRFPVGVGGEREREQCQVQKKEQRRREHISVVTLSNRGSSRGALALWDGRAAAGQGTLCVPGEQVPAAIWVGWANPADRSAGFDRDEGGSHRGSIV